MATRKPFDWNDPRNLKERAWDSVKEFFGKEEEDHPLSPEMVAKVSKGKEPKKKFEAEDNEGNQEERLHRITEERALNRNPNIWPG